MDLDIAAAIDAVAATHAAVGLADTEPTQEVFKHGVVPFRLEMKMDSPSVSHHTAGAGGRMRALA